LRILTFVSIEGVHKRSHIAKQSVWAWPEVTSLDTRGVGATANVKFILFVILAKHNNLAKTLSDVAGPSP